jgi:hypothetical protein
MLMLLMSPATPAKAQVSIGIGLPNVSIGINLPVFPELVAIPGYPVYYAPQMDANYFFYDGMYWVYQNDTWYASSWYNGPWGPVQPEVVPLFILRVPVRYYRQPPVYFRGWQSNAAPRWGQHWGRGWEQQRTGWNRWNRGSVPTRAPLPVYQRQYSGDRYPRGEQQHALRSQSYRYQPRDKAVQQHFKTLEQKAPAHEQRGRQEAPPARSQKQQEQPHGIPQDVQQPKPHQQGAPPDAHSQPPQRGGENAKRSAPVQVAPRQQAPESREQRQQPQRAEQPQREQQAPRAQGQDQRSQGRGDSQDSNHDRGQGQNKDEERGRGRDK